MNLSQYQTEVTALRDRVADLEAIIEAQKPRHEALTNLNAATGCTIAEARLLAAMSKGAVMAREQLIAVAGFEPDFEPRNIDSAMKRIRKRLSWLKIRTIYGAGYIIDLEYCRRIRSIMEGKPLE